MADLFDPNETARRRVYQHLRSFSNLLAAYTPGVPLSRFLTGFFRENKQMGSKDRKAVTRFAYHYFRLGHALKTAELKERLVMAEFLCSTESVLVEAENQELNARITWSLEDKLAWLEKEDLFHLQDVFPWANYLSPQLDASAFFRQFLIQPLLFVRLRKGKENKVQHLLEQHQIPFERLSDLGAEAVGDDIRQILALPNGTALDQIKGLKGQMEVQDLSSQRSLSRVTANNGESWWDACSGAGGKSLMLMDCFPDINLLVSDIRPSILRNLDERFEAAGIGNYRRKIIDLTKETTSILGRELFDGILLDAPCTGSGTWGRTPEMLSAFKESFIEEFAELQKNIAVNVARHLKPGGKLYYITCSVFSAENEEVVNHIAQQTGLSIAHSEYLTGYHDRADTLFVAELVK